jgi:ATP-dependent DNA helicase RecG
LRNKLIAEAFYLTKNIEKYGSGFIRIRKELKAYPEVTLRVEEIGDGVLVTFVRSEGVNEGLNEGVNLLYDTIQKRPGVRIPELSAHLNVPAKTLERWIKQLRKEKRITFKGSAKTGGYYTSNADEKN